MLIFPTEGDDCYIPKEGRGFCKRAFNCKWIRNNEIPENEWKICRYNVINPLVCCRDPMNDQTKMLNCENKMFTFAEAQLCFGGMELPSIDANQMENAINDDQVKMRQQEIEDSKFLSNEVVDQKTQEIDYIKKEIENDTPGIMQNKIDDIGISEGQINIMQNVEPVLKSVPQYNNEQVKQFHVNRQPSYNFGYISFIRQY